MLDYSKAKDLREVMVATFSAAVEDGKNIAVLVSDSTSTAKIAPFKEKYPERLINVGIAEQSLVGTAAGMALGGYIAVTTNAAPFLVNRANEQVKNDVCYSNTNVKMMSLNAGVCYGPLASTHHAIDDVSIMRGFGNVQIFAPSDGIEAAGIIRYALDHEGPVYVRMDAAKFPQMHEDTHKFEPGKIDILKEGSDITIFAMGSTVHEAMAAGLELAEAGIDAEIVNISSIRPFDVQGATVSLVKTGKAITVEEHSVHGGIGSLISETVADQGLGCRVKRLGFEEGKFAVSGPRDEMRSFIGIDVKGIVQTARDMVGK